LSPGAYENLKKKFVGQKERIEKAFSGKIGGAIKDDGHK